MADLLTVYDDDRENEFIDCEICSKRSRGETLFKIHQTTAQHLKREDVLVASGKIKRPPPLPVWIDLKHYLNHLQLDEPIIGLNSIVEVENTYTEDGQKVFKYKCRMCSVETDLTGMASHVVGRKHRQIYLELKRPDLVTWKGQDFRTVTQPGLVVRAKAAVVEKQEGQGNPLVLKKRDDVLPNAPIRKAGPVQRSDHHRLPHPREDFYEQHHLNENIRQQPYLEGDNRGVPNHYPESNVCGRSYPEDDMPRQCYQDNELLGRPFMNDDKSEGQYRADGLHARNQPENDKRGMPYTGEDVRRLPFPEEALRSRSRADVDLRDDKPYVEDEPCVRPFSKEHIERMPYLEDFPHSRAQWESNLCTRPPWENAVGERLYAQDHARARPYQKESFEELPSKKDDHHARPQWESNLRARPCWEDDVGERRYVEDDTRVRPYCKEDLERIPYQEADPRAGSLLGSDIRVRTRWEDDNGDRSYVGENSANQTYREENPHKVLYSRGNVRTEAPFKDGLNDRDLRGHFSGIAGNKRGPHPGETERYDEYEGIKDGSPILYKERGLTETPGYSKNYPNTMEKRGYSQDVRRIDDMTPFGARDPLQRPSLDSRKMLAEYREEQIPAKKKRKSRFTDATEEEVALAQRRQVEDFLHNERRVPPVAMMRESNKGISSRDAPQVSPDKGNVLDVLKNIDIESVEEANFLREKLCTLLKEFQANKEVKPERKSQVFSKEYSYLSNYMERHQHVYDEKPREMVKARHYEDDRRVHQGAVRCEEQPREMVKAGRYEGDARGHHEAARYEEGSRGSEEARHYEGNFRGSEEARHYEGDFRGSDEPRHYEGNFRGSEEARHYEGDFRGSEKARHYEGDFRGSEEARHYEGNFRGSEEARHYEGNFRGSEEARHYEGDFRGSHVTRRFEKESKGYRDSLEKAIPHHKDSWMFGERSQYHPDHRPGDDLYDPFHPSSSPTREGGNTSSLDKIASTLLELVARK